MPAPIALDILLDPGPDIAGRAAALNAGLVARGHDAIAFGPHAAPHLTLAQLFVDPAALGTLAAALSSGGLPAAAQGLPLTATGLGMTPFAGAQAVSILVERTPALAELHGRVCACAARFVAPADKRGFFRPPGAPDIHPGTFDHASGFLDRHAGPAFAPHVTVGLAPRRAAAALCDRPFAALTEPASGLALYRLGEYGTAAIPLGRPA